MAKRYYSKQGLSKLKGELQALKNEGRREIARQLSEARDKGDLKENAEYEAAKEAQGLLEHKIAKLERIVAQAAVVDGTKLDLSRVGIFSRVTVRNVATREQAIYTLVGEEEANLREKKISITSPIGGALMGKKLREVVRIRVPAGELTLEITEIVSGIDA